MTMTSGDTERSIELRQARDLLTRVGGELTHLYAEISAGLSDIRDHRTTLERTRLHVAHLLGVLGHDLPEGRPNPEAAVATST